MSITHTDPLTGLRMFEDAFTRMFSEPRSSRPWSPPVDIYETENELVFVADLPGFELNDIDLRMENQVLTIKGERSFGQQEGQHSFHRIERGYGQFLRSFSVPNLFDPENVAAEYKNGVLTVRLAKREAAKPKQIKVELK